MLANRKKMKKCTLYWGVTPIHGAAFRVINHCIDSFRTKWLQKYYHTTTMTDRVLWELNSSMNTWKGLVNNRSSTWIYNLSPWKKTDETRLHILFWFLYSTVIKNINKREKLQILQSYMIFSNVAHNLYMCYSAICWIYNLKKWNTIYLFLFFKF